MASFMPNHYPAPVELDPRGVGGAMGYSAATPMKSAKARDEMAAFLAEHYRPWHLIQPPEDEMFDMDFGPVSEEWDWSTHIYVGDDLDYNNGKLKIGFNFSSSMGVLGHYAFSILRWMALRAGAKRKVSKDYGDLGQSVPVMQYDYDPCWPVLARSEWEDRAPEQCWWCLTDEHGFKPIRRYWIPRNGSHLVERDEEILTGITLLSAPNPGWLVGKLRKALGISKSEAWKIVNNLPHTWEDEEIASSFTYSLTDKVPLESHYTTRTFKAGELSGRHAMMAAEYEPAAQAAEAVTQAELARLSGLWAAR